jgi:hypothetical protein
LWTTSRRLGGKEPAHGMPASVDCWLEAVVMKMEDVVKVDHLT